MGTRRDSNGRLNMDAVREDNKDESTVLPLRDKNVPPQMPSSQIQPSGFKGANFPERQDRYRRIRAFVQPLKTPFRESADPHLRGSKVKTVCW